MGFAGSTFRTCRYWLCMNVSCSVVGIETCAALAAAHVFGQCRACSCSHHMVWGQPFVPSRLSHLAVHGTINRTIWRFWVDDPQQLHWLYLVRISIVQTKRWVNLRQCQGLDGNPRTYFLRRWQGVLKAQACHGPCASTTSLGAFANLNQWRLVTLTRTS